jgi:hypothetical protein
MLRAQVLWMNKILRTLWPYYNAAIGQQVLEQATPIIAKQLKPVRTGPAQLASCAVKPCCCLPLSNLYGCLHASVLI